MKKTLSNSGVSIKKQWPYIEIMNFLSAFVENRPTSPSGAPTILNAPASPLQIQSGTETSTEISPIWIFIHEIKASGISSRLSQKIIVETMNFSIIYPILFTTVYVYNFVAYIMYQRLKFLNDYINHKEKTMTFDYDSIFQVLKVTAKIHHIIAMLAKKFDKTFGWGIFATISLSFILMIVSIVMRGEISQVRPIQAYVLNAILMVSSLLLVVNCQRIKYEAEKVRYSVCMLTYPYFDNELSNKRCTLLYQFLQEPLQLEGVGFYPLDVTVITLKEETVTLDKDSIFEVLKVTGEIHYIIAMIAKKFDKTFGWGIFTTISLSFMIVVVTIVMRGQISQFHPVQAYALNGILMISSIFVVITCQRIRFETHKVRCSVCMLTLPNFDKELSNKRCTLLYQLLQEPIELQASGFYPLDVTVITSHIGILSTLLMFFLNIRDVLDI
ncbi:hypothetical protein RN001_007586 [Aquatica leii]|uniref:Gustatory receptor n=1 Tax=Aquatica leii TaxID=1421715 RepID=A0AAN7Q4F6_9COLE|nr:hypothetical protein RN001_007586 [Aquatica leii]